MDLCEDAIAEISSYLSNKDYYNFISSCKFVHNACKISTKKRKYENYATIDLAAKAGDFGAVVYLHKQKAKCTYLAMDWAAEIGRIDILEWLHNNRTEGCTTHAMDWAAGSGYLQIVEWLDANTKKGCTFEAISLAAKNGYLEILQFLYKNYLEQFSIPDLLYLSCNHQCWDVVDWLFEYVAEDSDITKAIFIAKQLRDWEVYELLSNT